MRIEVNKIETTGYKAHVYWFLTFTGDFYKFYWDTAFFTPKYEVPDEYDDSDILREIEEEAHENWIEEQFNREIE